MSFTILQSRYILPTFPLCVNLWSWKPLTIYDNLTLAIWGLTLAIAKVGQIRLPFDYKNRRLFTCVANKLTLKNSAYLCFTNQHFTLHSSHQLAKMAQQLAKKSSHPFPGSWYGSSRGWSLAKWCETEESPEGSYDKNAPHPKPHTFGDVCRISTCGYL